MVAEQDASAMQEDWFSLGKADAWDGRPRQPPEHDMEAASLYDLGYSEGEINQPPTEIQPSHSENDEA